MNRRTRMFAVGAAAAAALAASTAAATAPSAAAATLTDTHQCVPAKPAPGTVPVKLTPGTGQPVKQAVSVAELAAKLGVTQAQLVRALPKVKMALANAGGTPSRYQFDDTLAKILGISPSLVRQVLPPMTPIAVKVTTAGSPRPGSPCVKPARGKASGRKQLPQQSQQQADAIAAAVASELNLSTSQVEAALQPLFAAGRVDTSSTAFATAASSLGVSVQQLASALAQAKQSLAPAS